MTSIALRNSDLPNGYSLRLVPGGTKVAGQVTLDNCGYHFTTEAHRVARRQYGMVDSTSADTGLENELVAYDTTADASKAVGQWHTAASTCPTKAVRSTVAGEPDLAYKISLNKLDVATLPAKVNVVTMESAAEGGKRVLFNVSILQAHGRYLDAIYLTNSVPLSGTDLDVAQSLAVVTGRRLAALK